MKSVLVLYVYSAWQMHIYVALWTTIFNWSLDILQHDLRADFLTTYLPPRGHFWAWMWTKLGIFVPPPYPFLCHGCNHWKSPFLGCEISQFNCFDILHLMRGQAISVHRPEYSAQGRSLFSCEAILEGNGHNISSHYFPVGAVQPCTVQWQNSWKRVSQQGGC